MVPMGDGLVRAFQQRAGLLRWLVVVFAGLLGTASVRAQQAGRELSEYVMQEDARLGGAAGTIVLSQAGRLGEPVTLGRGHALEVRAAVTWAATVRLAGDNAVRCSPEAVITAELPAFALNKQGGMLLLAEGTRGVRVEGCHVRSAAESVLLAGLPVSDVQMRGNVLEGLTLVAVNSPNTGPSERLEFDGNSVTMPAGGGKLNAGLLLFYARGVTASGDVLTRVAHGVQWWGGDSGAPGMTVAQVKLAGKMSFTGNTCKDVGGACIWGSMGEDVVMRGNTADGCGDVCFDAEGGLRTQIVENTATRCGNGCAAVFFFTSETVIARNHFRADAPGGGLIFIKNASQNPVMHQQLRIEGNELRCISGVCRAVYQEAASGISFRGNEVVDGTWLPVGYASAVVIAGNHFVLTRPLPAGGAAIAAPAVIGGTALEVVGNVVESRVRQGADVACVAATWSDYNAVDPGLIAGNACGVTGMFSVGVRVSSTGANPGLFGAWVVGKNRLYGATVEHAGARERFVEMGECGGGGCAVDAAALAQARALPGCGGVAPSAGAVCLGAVRGWAEVPSAP